MSILLYKCSYCLNECSQFDQVSRSFCDLTTCTSLLAYIKYPGNIQLKTEKPQDQLSSSSSLRLLLLIASQLWDVLQMFFGGFEHYSLLPYHSKFSANTTSDVTTAAPRWPPILGSTGQLRTAEKAVFACRIRKKSWQYFQVRFKLYYYVKISHAKISFQ